MPLLVCPNCDAGMKAVVRNGVELDVCTGCKGVWLDRGELEKLMSAMRQVETEHTEEVEFYRYREPERRTVPPIPRETEWRRRDDDDDDDDRRKGRKRRSMLDVFDIFD